MVSSDKPTAYAVQPDIVVPSDAPTQSPPNEIVMNLALT